MDNKVNYQAPAAEELSLQACRDMLILSPPKFTNDWEEEW